MMITITPQAPMSNSLLCVSSVLPGLLMTDIPKGIKTGLMNDRRKIFLGTFSFIPGWVTIEML